jgi:ketosteroid isomerase-like protein
MRTCLACCLLFFAPLTSSSAAQPSSDVARARAEILPLIQAMQAAANAHDAEKHVSYYAHDPGLLFVINDRAITGYDALLEQQREWWQNGKSDVIYTLTGEPMVTMAAPGLVTTTDCLTSRRTMPDGAKRSTRFGISALWQRRPEGWRIIHAHESTVNQ